MWQSFEKGWVFWPFVRLSCTSRQSGFSLSRQKYYQQAFLESRTWDLWANWGPASCVQASTILRNSNIICIQRKIHFFSKKIAFFSKNFTKIINLRFAQNSEIVAYLAKTHVFCVNFAMKNFLNLLKKFFYFENSLFANEKFAFKFAVRVFPNFELLRLNKQDQLIHDRI